LGAVVSIGKLAIGQEGYYLEQAQGRVDRASSVGSGVEDYYVQGAEAPGYWLGAGADRLDAIGVVDRQSLTRALEGQDPATGRELVAPHMRRVPGFDVTFSAPKSVSVLFGLGDERLRSIIRSEHDSAVAEAFGYLERVAANGRRGAGGAISIQGRARRLVASRRTGAAARRGRGMTAGAWRRQPSRRSR
jgi:conjugative relaxase-like TrwC/TraI family protein